MEPILGLVVAGGLAVVAAIGHYNSARQRMQRALKREPLSRIADLRDGELVSLVGKIAYASEPLKAPLSGRACACYQTMVQQYDRPRINELLGSEFWLVDNSGRVLVRALSPAMNLSLDARWSSGGLDDPTAKQRAFVERHQQTTYDDTLVGHFNKDLTYHEGVLEAGEEIVVFGLCKMEFDPEPPAGGEHGYRESPMRQCIVNPPGARMLISDDANLVNSVLQELLGRG